MKKLGCIFVATLLLGACYNTHIKQATTAFNHPESGTLYAFVPVGVKGFEIKGVIFVKSRVDIDINGDKNGSEITYEMLMREAVKLGADDVMNVRIDRQESTRGKDFYNVSPTTEEETFSHRQYIQKSYTYTATALAVKYKDLVVEKGTEMSTVSSSESLNTAQQAENNSTVIAPTAATAVKNEVAKKTKRRSLFR